MTKRVSTWKEKTVSIKACDMEGGKPLQWKRVSSAKGNRFSGSVCYTFRKPSQACARHQENEENQACVARGKACVLRKGKPIWIKRMF